MKTPNPRILIVEDEQAIADNLQYALETEGFETLCLSSGLPVISLLAKLKFLGQLSPKYVSTY